MAILYFLVVVFHTLSEGNLRQRLQRANVCVKTHEWHSEYVELMSCLAQHVVLTHRDLRGVCASYRRVGWASRISQEYVSDHMRWRSVATHDVRCEDVIRDGVSQLALAEHRELSLTPADIEAVHAALTTLKAQSGVVDQVTKLWPEHVSANTVRLLGVEEAPDSAINPLRDESYSQKLGTLFPEYMSVYGYD